jgi:hypothetical protein
MNIKPTVLSLSALFAAAAQMQAGTVSFAVEDFNDTAQLSTAGTLVDAAHFGNAAEADVTANGIVFVARSVDTAHIVVGDAGGNPFPNGTLYDATTHKEGYTDIAGMSAGDQSLMFDSVVYAPGVGNSLVTLSGLIVGHDYEFQILNVDDRPGSAGDEHLSSNDPAEATLFGPYDVTQNAVQLLTGTFTADAETQTFRDYVLKWKNAQFCAYQLRDLSPPEDVVLMITSPQKFENNGNAETLEIPFTNGGGNDNLTITKVTPTGDDTAFFPTATFDTDVEPGNSGFIHLGFDPSLPGGGVYDYAVTLTIDSNDSLNPSKTIEVELEVISPIAVVAPAALDYGNLGLNPGPQTLDVTISNAGGIETLSIDSIDVAGDDAGLFSAGTFPTTIAPGGSADVTITFDPGSEDGTFSAELEIDTNGQTDSFFTIPMTAMVKITDPDASLVSHFTFDDAGNLGDDTGSYDNDGTLVGDAQQTSASRVGTGALLLDGDGDLIDLGTGTGADYTEQIIANGEGFTVACWGVVPADSTGIRMRLFSSYMPGGWNGKGWGVGFVEGSPADPGALRLLGTTYGIVDYYPADGSAPAFGAWHHFAYVFRNNPINRIDYYIDGALVESVTRPQTGMKQDTTIGFAIGAIGAPSGPALDQSQYFDGRIDDLRIYDRELAAANIADLYASAPQLSAYDTWAASFGLDPAGNGAPDQDPEGDGLDNAIEFLLGSNPASGVQTNLPAGTRDSDNFVVVYPRKLAAAGAGFSDSVEYGSDLVGWTPAIDGIDGVTISTTSLDADTEQVTVTIPATGRPVQFAHVVVTMP